MTQVAYQTRKSPHFNHIEWLELHQDGTLHECAIMKRDAQGNVLFFKTSDLDDIDRERLATILRDRNAANLQLWELMSQRRLNNGVNALNYFNQLVRVITPSGKIMDPRAGQVGAGRAGEVKAK